MRWWSYAILRDSFGADEDWGGGRKVTPPPRQPDIQPPANRFVKIWRGQLDRECRRTTDRIIKTEQRRNPEPHRVHIKVWGQERQRAMMEVGWVPLAETGAEMLLYLDIGHRL